MNYRYRQPQASGDPFITDGGLETTLIYLRGMRLPSFASIVMMKDDSGRNALREYFLSYIAIARRHQVGLILESATWRASPDWGAVLGFSKGELARANSQAIEELLALQAKEETPATRIVVSGCIGPRGDGYNPDKRMSAEDAERYHRWQVDLLKEAGADLVSALTMNYEEEAVGLARAATAAGMPVVISFTVETNGRLPTGQTVPDAIQAVDQATGTAPVYYMINCAHPQHFDKLAGSAGSWLRRVRGFRVNASVKSHAELDAATELDAGNPEELGGACVRLARAWPNVNILGGCCGTDERHLEAIATRLRLPGSKSK